MANRLADATSPYLVQHAENPVDWFQWGEEAFAEARRREVPILLSVGYAACHWCHVMAHESFEDPAIAAVMNERFVCVKVDREERPDVDAIYMDAVQAMSGRGGWPMTVFLTPAGEPFFAGTYFPPEDRHGMPGFRGVLEGIAQAWAERREDLVAQGARVVEHLSRPFDGSQEPLTEEILREALAGLRGAFDPEWGGFGPAPKFPQPMTLELLLRLHLRGFDGALDMATVTLDRMAAGGMHDQVGGGFHRYSTDREWRVPHFEKMLYDNAQLSLVYLHAWQVTGAQGYRTVCERTLEYLLREMRAADGGFFSSQDADTEGEEGRFYVWSWEELVGTVGEAGARRLGARPEGNWEGTNVLLIESLGEGGDRIGAYQDAVADEAFLETRERASVKRALRPRPATDDKVLAGWNGLAIRAFAEAGRALGEPRYVEAAERAARFVLSALRREDGRLLRAWRDGRTSGPAYAEDHAMLAAGLLALYETTFDLRWFREAQALADDLLRLFHDPERGGFFQAGSDQEALVVRQKEVFDNAVPSGNSVAADVLQRLALLTGEAAYETAAVSALRLVRGNLGRAPTGFGHALGALDLYLSAAKEIAVIGAVDGPLLAEARRRYLPNAVLAASLEPTDAVSLLEGKTLVDGKTAAYVCERFACRKPVTDPAELAAQLGQATWPGEPSADSKGRPSADQSSTPPPRL